ncbi:hypothetical protein O3M35_010120 [Rhynocoris fuscipes]|uniref:HAUS augmin-like complex subunit 6 N-terminal domain-containing protein n=1 Tax=Rhynocoris fuscipes TaxID=488301 RepID=A0AAW1D3Y2_9HEMI
MDTKNDELWYTSLELIKIMFSYHSPNPTLKDFVEKGQPLNESTVSLILYYIFGIISSDKTKEFLLPFWPVSHETRPRFRIGIKKIVAWMKVEWPDFPMNYSQLFLLNPHDAKFFEFLLKITLFTSKLLAQRNNLEFVNGNLELTEQDLAAAATSFKETKQQMNQEYQNALVEGRKFVEENVILRDCLENQKKLLQDLIRSFPSNYHELLLSDDWQSVVESEDYKKLKEDNLKNIEKIEAIASLLSELSDGSLTATVELDSHELFKYGIKDMLDPNIKDSEIPLDKVLKICKESSDNYLHFLQNNPLSFEDQEELQIILTEVEDTCNFYRGFYEKLIDFKRRAMEQTNVLETLLIEKNPDPMPRKLSQLFDSPELSFPDVNIEDSPFSSPGISGEQLLQDLKKNSKLKQNDETPVSRKMSKIPRILVSQFTNKESEPSNDEIIARQSSSKVSSKAGPSSNNVSSMDGPTSSNVSSTAGPSSSKVSSMSRPSSTNVSSIAGPTSSNESSTAGPSSSNLNSCSGWQPPVSKVRSKPSLDSSTSPLAISLLQKQICHKRKQSQPKQSYRVAEVFSSTVCSNISPEDIPTENTSVELPSPISDRANSEVDSSDINISDDEIWSEDPPSGLTQPSTGRPSLDAIFAKYFALRERIDE